RDQTHKDIINIRASYYDEIVKIVQYLHTQKGVTKFAVFYQNDAYGYEGYISLLQILDQKGLALAAEGTYKRNSLSINHAFNELKKSDAQAVIMIGASLSTTYFLQRAQKQSAFNDTTFATVSFSNANAIVKRLESYNNIIFSQVVPSYNDTSIDIVKQYRKIYGARCKDCEYGFISFEAFIAAKLIVQTLSKLPSIQSTSFVDSLKKEVAKQKYLNSVYLFEYSGEKFIKIDHE
ncbi:MAG: ABC transporter substrate-binding protein, partial [Campylobacterota bacterium]